MGRPLNKEIYECEFCKLKFRRKIPYKQHKREEHEIYFKRRYVTL